ncbi:MAG TPA: GTPase Era [Longimicrobiaceae bacterium]
MEAENEPSSGSPGQTRAGTVALVGYPNAGKSSLLNRFLDQKLSIVTSAPQTTRERVLGIDTRDDVQIVFVDTPGLVDPRYLLHRAMLHSVLETIPDVDVAVLLLDPTSENREFSEEVLELLRRKRSSLLVVVNKTDVARRERLRELREWARETLGTDVLEVSAQSGEGVEALRERIAELLPVSPFLYPPDEISSQPVRFFVAELIRETVFEQYGQEVPYSTTAKVDEFRENADPLYIRATIFVERPTQKAIVIGKGGAAIKKLGQAARLKVEEFVGAPVYLDLWVKVLPKWRKDPLSLARLGFKLPTEP